MQAGRLRGRGSETSRALAVIRAARQRGRGGAVLVTGVAGIGKSALLAEVCRQASHMEVRTVVGDCDPIGPTRPGAPVIDALRGGRSPLVSAQDYERIAASANDPLALFENIASAVERAAATGPIMIAIDDIQWADRVSRFLLRALLARQSARPVVWLLASQGEEVGLLSKRVQVERLRLAPLTAADLTAIAQDRLGRAPDGQVRRYLESCAGNPLLANVILEDLAWAAARGQRDTELVPFAAGIARRFTDLPPRARELVEAVAVAGRALALDEVVRLQPEGVGSTRHAAMTAALASGLVVAREGRLAPRHDLVGRALCSAMPERNVARLHRRFAEQTLRAGRPLLAAAHAREAAKSRDMGSTLILVAAAEQLAAASPLDAGEFAALAFRIVRADQREWLEVARRCLAVLCRTQQPAQALAVADAILACTEAPDLIGETEYLASRTLWLDGQFGRLLARSTALLSTGALRPALAARLAATVALANTRLLPGEIAAREAANALECAQASSDLEAIAVALHAVGEAARNQGRHQDALDSFEQLRALAGPRQLAEEITTLQLLDRYEQAQDLLDKVEFERGAAGPSLPALRCAQMWQDFNLGRVQDAESAACLLLDLDRQLGGVYAEDALIVHSAAHLLRGEADRAAEPLDKSERFTDADAQVRSPAMAVLRGWLAASQGNLPGALELLGPVVYGADSSCGYWPVWPCWTAILFEIGRAGADEGFVDAVIGVAELAASRNSQVASFEGMALNLRGQSRTDVPMLAEAARILACSPRPLLRAYGADCYGRALLAVGERAAALTELDRAWDDYHLMDARIYRSKVQRTMREAGSRRAKWSAVADTRPHSGWTSLTAAEREVALLIARGHSNRSAASELGVSIHTVSTHLRMVFGKLGVQSRVQLANAMHGTSAAQLG